MSTPQSSNYVRGQITVAIVVAIMFIVLRSLVCAMRQDIGDFCGDLEFDPYLGSFQPCYLLCIGLGSRTRDVYCWVLIVFAVEQTIEGRFVSLFWEAS